MSIKFDIEKFDGRINFGLWQVQVKDVLIQAGLYKALKGKPIPLTSRTSSDESGGSSEDSEKSSKTGGMGKSTMSDEDWEELDMRAASQIRLCLAKNVLANVVGLSTTKELWAKLEELYQTKSISNRLYLKEQFYKLQMEEGTKISDHLSVLNGIVSELESIGVKIDDEDKALRLILSLPYSYKHMKPILMYGKDVLVFSEVTSKLISEERSLRDGDNRSPENSAFTVSGNWKKKKNSLKKKIICWGCGQSGHAKKDCKFGGANSASSSKNVAANASFEKEDDELSI